MWEASTSEGKADSGIRVGGPGLADLELVGSPPENDLAFPDSELGDVGGCSVRNAGWNSQP